MEQVFLGIRWNVAVGYMGGEKVDLELEFELGGGQRAGDEEEGGEWWHGQNTGMTDDNSVHNGWVMVM